MIKTRSNITIPMVFLSAVFVYSGGLVLNVVFSNVLYVFLPYYLLPWSEVVTTFLQIITVYFILNSSWIRTQKSSTRLIVIFCACGLLFALGQYSNVVDSSPMFCGMTTPEEYQKIFDKRFEVEELVKLVKTVFISSSILIYGVGLYVKSE